MLVALLAAAVVLVAAGPASAGRINVPPKEVARVTYPGLKRITFKYGPIAIKPGQNDIRLRGLPKGFKPPGPGYITRFRPTLIRADGSVPSVDVIHLHHAVWLINSYPSFAAGEEKTVTQMPKGFGYRYQPGDRWLLNDMIHNLETKPESVYVVWEVDFLPDSSPAAKTMKTVRSQWMDVAGLSAYPVFDALRSQGKKDRFTFPKQARGAERKKIGGAGTWTVPRDLTLVGTAGHLHPGGLFTDMTVTRDGKTVKLFHSKAKYYGPAGAVTWNVAMTGTSSQWRVKLKQGDVVKISATYDTSRASWYEVMGIMVIAVYDGTNAGGSDPFAKAPPLTGELTHGELLENRDTAGGAIGMPDPRSMSATKFAGGAISISDFFYGAGDLNKRTKIPTIKSGQPLSFDNADWGTQGVEHTITACAAPCNRRGGISFPLANAKVEFDSGNLGYGYGLGAGRTTWATPANLPDGTYPYFCRIHPFMRGAFKVKG